MCALAGPVNVMLRKMLSPDMTHQLRAAVLPLEVWAVLSTGNVCGIWLADSKEVRRSTVNMFVQTLLAERDFAVFASNRTFPMEKIIAEAAANMMNTKDALSADLAKAMLLSTKGR